MQGQPLLVCECTPDSPDTFRDVSAPIVDITPGVPIGIPEGQGLFGHRVIPRDTQVLPCLPAGLKPLYAEMAIARHMDVTQETARGYLQGGDNIRSLLRARPTILSKNLINELGYDFPYAGPPPQSVNWTEIGLVHLDGSEESSENVQGGSEPDPEDTITVPPEAVAESLSVQLTPLRRDMVLALSHALKVDHRVSEDLIYECQGVVRERIQKWLERSRPSTRVSAWEHLDADDDLD